MSRQQPEAGVDYPADYPEFLRWFPDDESCAQYLSNLRWEDGFTCPHCQHMECWTRAGGARQCKQCLRRCSVTAGTALGGTHKGLQTWFSVAWFVTNQKSGVSALGLQAALGLPSYPTAWAWLQKLRRAMVRPGRDRLSGDVEVDETLVGGVEKGVKGRETRKKSLVLVMAERDGLGIGRIRLAVLKNASAEAIVPAIKEAIEPGSTIHCDAWKAYEALEGEGYTAEATNISKSKKKAHELFPRVHRVASLLKRWLLGTHQGAVRPEYLGYYLDEFTFRFNRRTSTRRGLLFYRLLEQAVRVEHTTYKQLLSTSTLAKRERQRMRVLSARESVESSEANRPQNMPDEAFAVE